MPDPTEYKFIIRTDKPLSQRDKELQLAEIRSHVNRNTLHTSTKQQLQFVSCNRPSTNERPAASSKKVLNSHGSQEAITAVVAPLDSSDKAHGSGTLSLVKTLSRAMQHEKAAERYVGESDQVVSLNYSSPWHWCKGARVEPFNIVPWAADAAYEMDLSR
jgi:hypothetical protein